jgi:hypothetical protein
MIIYSLEFFLELWLSEVFQLSIPVMIVFLGTEVGSLLIFGHQRHTLLRSPVTAFMLAIDLLMGLIKQTTILYAGLYLRGSLISDSVIATML